MSDLMHMARVLAQHCRTVAHKAGESHVVGVGPGSRLGLQAAAQELAVLAVGQAQEIEQKEKQLDALVEQDARAASDQSSKPASSGQPGLYAEIAQYKGENRPYTAGSLVSLRI